MGTESFEVWTTLPASPEEIYAAWLDASAHSAFTGGGAASVERSVGGRFTAWDGYIQGTNRELEENRRIVQTWRTTEFAEDDPDSILEVLLEPDPEGTRVTLRHSNVPEGQGRSYESGWQTHYFEPMVTYFSARSGARAAKKAPAKEAPAKKAPARKAPARKAPAKKAPAKKTAAKKAPAKKAPAKKAPAKKAPAKKASAKKASAKKAPAKRTSAKKGK